MRKRKRTTPKMKATHREEYVPVTRKSRAGIVYTRNVPVIVEIK